MIRPIDNPNLTEKNSLLRVRNAEQSQTLKMNHTQLQLMQFHMQFFKLFGITVSKNLRQFLDQIGITHQPCALTLNCLGYLKFNPDIRPVDKPQTTKRRSRVL